MGMITNKINLVINLSILALLIYLAVNVNKLNEKVFPDPNVMIPMSENYDQRLEDLVKNLIINKLEESNAQN
jgi:cell division protein FtsX|tara:strand:- start:153 stop:368 length:216 start_codon:yes stop_codon:yes gene_type:complete